MIDIIFGNMFNGVFETHEVTFEIYIKDKLTNRQTMQAPKEMIMANFLQTAQQIQRDNRPIKLKLLRKEVIWDNFENKEKALDCFVSICNSAMEEWEKKN